MTNRFSETRSASLYIAFFIAAFEAVLFLILWLLYGFAPLWLVITLSGLLFAFSYFLSKYAIERFVYQKIKLIYKTIHDFRSSKASKVGKNESLELVNESVLEWGHISEPKLKSSKNGGIPSRISWQCVARIKNTYFQYSGLCAHLA